MRVNRTKHGKDSPCAVGANYYYISFGWVMQRSPHFLRVYCPFCFWAQSSTAAKFCAYGHGRLNPITQYNDQLLEGL